MSGIKVNLMLAQWAQVHQSGTVNIGGGGLAVIPYQGFGYFIAGNALCGWDAIGSKHLLTFELLDAQSDSVTGDNGDSVVINAEFSLAPTPGLAWGSPMSLPVVVPAPAVELAPASLYEWRYQLDGETQDDWALSFSTMPEAQAAAA